MVCLHFLNVLKILTAGFESNFPTFNGADKEYNVLYLSLMDIIGKAEMRVKR